MHCITPKEMFLIFSWNIKKILGAKYVKNLKQFKLTYNFYCNNIHTFFMRAYIRLKYYCIDNENYKKLIT
jgi:hypothetical protein